VRESEPKTAKSRRSVALDPLTITVLRQHRDRQLEERGAAGPAWTESGHVFVREDGEPYHPQRIAQLFQRATRQAGLPPIRLHDLRHTSATLALSAGIHPKVVQERLGHSYIAITLDTYSHVVQGMQAEAATRVAELIFDPD
jgi:integrase